MRMPGRIWHSRDGKMLMRDSQFAETVKRPAACPSCKGAKIDTLAKVITAETAWRCRECHRVWTIGSARTSSMRKS